MKIVAAIPNYNMGASLKLLVEQLAEENFDKIYVLDDASLEKTVAILGRLPPNTTVLRSENKLGAGATRNRIIEEVKDGLVFFIDADMELITRNIREKVENLFKDANLGIAGFKITAKNGLPMKYNFGSEMHPVKVAVAEFMVSRSKKNLAFAEWAYNNGDTYFKGYNPKQRNLPAQEVDWTAEGCFAIPAKLLVRVGGYDPVMRYHETHDLSHKIRKLGYKVRFSPEVIVKHLEIKVGGVERKDTEGIPSEAYFYKKYYGLSDEAFRWLYDLPQTNRKPSDINRLTP